jgi:hypothetical protein
MRLPKLNQTAENAAGGHTAHWCLNPHTGAGFDRRNDEEGTAARGDPSLRADLEAGAVALTLRVAGLADVLILCGDRTSGRLSATAAVAR